MTIENMPSNNELLGYALHAFVSHVSAGGKRSFGSFLVEGMFIYTGDERFDTNAYQKREKADSGTTGEGGMGEAIASLFANSGPPDPFE